MPDDEIHQITWENACRFYNFDPLAHRDTAQCTVGALRAEATDVDITPKSYGMPERIRAAGRGTPELNRVGRLRSSRILDINSSDRLDLRELLETVRAPLATDAALLEAAEGAALADAGHGVPQPGPWPPPGLDRRWPVAAHALGDAPCRPGSAGPR